MKAFFSNHLIHEKSPYLLQHAHNPVDWYPWGEKAFLRAKKEDKPIFLSIGYATCHWCHVMERESFQNIKVAESFNKVFICIKVDREEHPEVDMLYMDFAQAMLSSGAGWPLNLFLTSDLKPFYAITYLPPETKKGMMGLIPLAEHIEKLWNGETRQQIFQQADHMVHVFQDAYTLERRELPENQLLQETTSALLSQADLYYGGIKGSPKFPMPYLFEFLIRFSEVSHEKKPLDWALLSFEMIRRGGVYDHLGGGFSRYSVDAKWLIPHFEKMLCDNALFISSYLEGYLKTSDEKLKTVAEETLGYILREMTREDGGFYSAQDADTDGEEGLYYTWTTEEIETLLLSEEKELFLDYYNLSKEGNFENRCVLYISETLEEFSHKHKKDKGVIQKILSSAKQKLFLARASREPLLKDDKIVTAWNGLTIDAMAKASRVLGDDTYLKACCKAAEFIKERLTLGEKLLRCFREEAAKQEGLLEDYVFLIKGLLSLFEVTLSEDYLRWAENLADQVEKIFKSDEGGYYHAPPSEYLLLRKRDFSDGALPSANAVHAENLIRLYELTFNESYLTQAETIFKVGHEQLEDFPLSSVYQAMALLRYYDKRKALIVVALDDDESLRAEILELVLASYQPHCTLLFKPSNQMTSLEILRDKIAVDGQTAIYICEDKKCLSPMLQLEQLKEWLDSQAH